MIVAIIASSDSPADMNIKARLLELYEFSELDELFEGERVFEKNLGQKIVKIYTSKTRCVYNDDIDKKIRADLFIFATTHRSEAGIPSLCVHSPGNFSKAGLGGKDRKLCIAPAGLIREMLFKLDELAKGIGMDVVEEVTHHGPYLEKPVMFIEIGCGEKEWANPDYGRIIARTIIDILAQMQKKYRVAFGIGGLHTAPNFKRAMEKTDIAMGHICPKYMLEALDQEMILQAIEKTSEKVDFVLLDWKGLKTEKQRILALLEELGLEYKRTDQI